MRRLDTFNSILGWSPDGTEVTKRRRAGARSRRRFRNELRVNRLIAALRPGLPTPALLAHDVQLRSLTFEAVAGEPLGPKYPSSFGVEDLDRTLAVEQKVRRFQPRRRWLPRVDPVRRLDFARRGGWLTADEHEMVINVAYRAHIPLRFAHGDLIARNLLDTGADLVLIDWEWAGLHPVGFDLAMLWFSIVDVPGARARLESLVDVDEAPFLVSALLVQLWHLHWFTPPEFRPTGLATRDHLVARLDAFAR